MTNSDGKRVTSPRIGARSRVGSHHLTCCCLCSVLVARFGTSSPMCCPLLPQPRLPPESIGLHEAPPLVKFGGLLLLLPGRLTVRAELATPQHVPASRTEPPVRPFSHVPTRKRCSQPATPPPKLSRFSHSTSYACLARSFAIHHVLPTTSSARARASDTRCAQREPCPMMRPW